MSYIVLEESLINEFFKFYYNKNYNPDITQKIFNHFKPFLLTNEQIVKYFENDNIALQQALSTQIPYCEYIDIDSELYSENFYKEMLAKSKYKILLTQNAISLNTLDCHKICIEDKPTHIYAKKFESGSNRDEAKKHIVSLMKNANKIIIIDKFLYKDNIINNLISWFNENALNQDIEFTLKGQKQQLSFNTIEAKFKNKGYKVICQSIDDSTHDRYIIIDDKISINLTSGLEYLFKNDKDFTYIVSEK